MIIAQMELEIDTPGQGLVEITQNINAWVSEQIIVTGLLTIFCRHTSASLTIQENADRTVRNDLEKFFNRLVIEDTSLYSHTAEGPDDMPAHIRGALTDVSLNIPVSRRRPVLGRWQGVFLFEHRSQPHCRKVAMHLAGK